jgi:16S rRNA (cytidine1402-2'-O)-methyltransferase
MGILYLVATPIGNLEDVTLRALRVLGEVSIIAAEDTRRTRKLLAHYEIKTRLMSYHDHNKRERQGHILEALEIGDVALVSDAGTPGLSDPGFELVQAMLEAGHQVVPLPGASAPIAALVASGLPTDAFVFIGYLPRRSSDRRKLLTSLIKEERTMIAFEAPHRLQASLQDMMTIFGDARNAAICRELTKIHEEIVRGPLCELVDHFTTQKPRGEFTLVIAGKSQGERWQEPRVREVLREFIANGHKPSDAARHVASQSGWTRNQVYQLVLEEQS